MDISLDLNPASSAFGDLLFVDGSIVLSRDGDARGAHPVLQNVLQRLRMFRGEWYLNTAIGVPYYQQIFVKGVNRAAIDNIFKATITSTPGILLLTSFEATYDEAKRTLNIRFSATTRQGTITYDGPLNTASGMVVQ